MRMTFVRNIVGMRQSCISTTIHNVRPLHLALGAQLVCRPFRTLQFGGGGPVHNNILILAYCPYRVNWMEPIPHAVRCCSHSLSLFILLCATRSPHFTRRVSYKWACIYMYTFIVDDMDRTEYCTVACNNCKQTRAYKYTCIPYTSYMYGNCTMYVYVCVSVVWNLLVRWTRARCCLQSKSHTKRDTFTRILSCQWCVALPVKREYGLFLDSSSLAMVKAFRSRRTGGKALQYYQHALNGHCNITGNQTFLYTILSLVRLSHVIHVRWVIFLLNIFCLFFKIYLVGFAVSIKHIL